MQKRLLDFQNSDEFSPTGDEPETPQLALVPGGRVNYNAAQLHAARISLSQLEQYGADWLNEARCMRQSAATIAGKTDTLKRLVWFLKHSGISHFGPRELQRFVHYISVGHEDAQGRWGNPRLKKPASDRTVQYYFIYARGFCRWMMGDIYVPVEVDLSHAVKVVKPTQPIIQTFSETQFEALRVAARTSTQSLRDEAIFLFSIDTGVRASELCRLQWGDVELHAGYGQAKVLGKGKKYRVVPFSRLASRFLWKYVSESPRTKQCPVFQSARGKGSKGAALTRYGLLQIYERLGEVAQLQGVRCSPHTMRHTFAINYLRRGGNVFSLQAILGHTDLKMTQIYCRMAQADIHNQHAQFSPADAFGLKKFE